MIDLEVTWHILSIGSWLLHLGLLVFVKVPGFTDLGYRLPAAGGGTLSCVPCGDGMGRE